MPDQIRFNPDRHQRYEWKIQELASDLPEARRKGLYRLLGDIYEGFGNVVAFQQIQGISTGMSKAVAQQARHLGSPDAEMCVDIDTKIFSRCMEIANNYRELGGNPEKLNTQSPFENDE